MGVRVLAQRALLGPYDFCTVLMPPTRRPWPESLVLGSRGTLKTLTLAAIPIDDYIEAVRNVSGD